MEFCFTCKTTAVKTTDSFCSNCGSKQPSNVECRKVHVLKRRIYSSLGPNDCWHVDGFDKLKPFKFSIHVCINGHSRTALWLKVGKSKSNRKIIASYCHL